MRPASPFGKVAAFLADLNIQALPVDELSIKLRQTDVEVFGSDDLLIALQLEFPKLHLAWAAATNNYLCLERHPFGIGLPAKPAIKLEPCAVKDLLLKLESAFPSPTPSTMVGVSRWLCNQNIEHTLHRSGRNVFITLTPQVAFGTAKQPCSAIPSGFKAISALEEYGILPHPHEVKETLAILED